MRKSVLTQITAAVTAAVLVICCMSGCGANGKNANAKDDMPVYAFVAKSEDNPYMEKVFEGFETACAEISAQARFAAPSTPSVEEQKTIIDALADEKVDGIAVAANDYDDLQPTLEMAMRSGIPVISLDSAVNKNSRITHIQQADPEMVGRSLIRTAYDIIGGNGGIAVLSSTEQASNQNLWIEWMKTELSDYPDKYAQMPLITTVYGDDEPEASARETRRLLQNPSVKLIIAPTTVGIKAAAEVITQAGSDVKLTGLGLPSEMKEYIYSGICPRMYLWNPADIGYLAAYTLNSVSTKDISGAVGDKFRAGDIGAKVIIKSEDEGTEVVLGDPLEFDISNIDEWSKIY